MSRAGSKRLSLSRNCRNDNTSHSARPSLPHGKRHQYHQTGYGHNSGLQPAFAPTPFFPTLSPYSQGPNKEYLAPNPIEYQHQSGRGFSDRLDHSVSIPCRDYEYDYSQPQFGSHDDSLYGSFEFINRNHESLNYHPYNDNCQYGEKFSPLASRKTPTTFVHPPLPPTPLSYGHHNCINSQYLPPLPPPPFIVSSPLSLYCPRESTNRIASGTDKFATSDYYLGCHSVNTVSNNSNNNKVSAGFSSNLNSFNYSPTAPHHAYNHALPSKLSHYSPNLQYSTKALPNSTATTYFTLPLAPISYPSPITFPPSTDRYARKLDTNIRNSNRNRENSHAANLSKHHYSEPYSVYQPKHQPIHQLARHNCHDRNNRPLLSLPTITTAAAASLTTNHFDGNDTLIDDGTTNFTVCKESGHDQSSFETSTVYKTNHQYDNNNKDSRAKVEMPCRTLFCRNVAPSAGREQLLPIFAQYGQIKEYCDKNHENRGILFVSYYDLRETMRAYNELQGIMVCGRPIDVHYSLPRTNDEILGPCSRNKNQGTLVVSTEGSDTKISNHDIQNLFAKFGEIRNFREFRNYEYKKFIEFYDSRAATAAHDELNGMAIQGAKFNIRFAWDYPRNLRVNSEQALCQYREDREKSNSAATVSLPYEDRHYRLKQRNGCKPEQQRTKQSASRSPVTYTNLNSLARPEGSELMQSKNYPVHSSPTKSPLSTVDTVQLDACHAKKLGEQTNISKYNELLPILATNEPITSKQLKAGLELTDARSEIVEESMENEVSWPEPESTKEEKENSSCTNSNHSPMQSSNVTSAFQNHSSVSKMVENSKPIVYSPIDAETTKPKDNSGRTTKPVSTITSILPASSNIATNNLPTPSLEAVQQLAQLLLQQTSHHYK